MREEYGRVSRAELAVSYQWPSLVGTKLWSCLGQGWGWGLLGFAGLPLFSMVPIGSHWFPSHLSVRVPRVPRLCSGALSESTAFICWTLKESAGQHSIYPLRLGPLLVKSRGAYDDIRCPHSLSWRVCRIHMNQHMCHIHIYICIYTNYVYNYICI